MESNDPFFLLQEKDTHQCVITTYNLDQTNSEIGGQTKHMKLSLNGQHTELFLP